MTVEEPVRIFIDQKYLEFVPRPTPEQYEALKESIAQDGQLESIIVSRSGKVLDGHTRFKICGELGIVPRYEVRDFTSEDDEKNYAILTNLKRRHLTPFQIVELVQSIRKELQKKKRVEANEYISKVRTGKAEPIDKADRLENTTRYKLAELTGLGSTTIDKANYIIDHGTKKDRQEASTGSLEQTYQKLVNRRRTMEGVTKRSNRVFPKCEKCSSDTRFKGKCHVHKQYCCRKCSWGK